MKRLVAVPVFLLLCFAPLAASAQQPSKAVPLNPPSAKAEAGNLQTVGTVGDTSYAWTNGNGWQSMDDNGKVAMIVGLEQGLVLAVRENWDAVTAADQPILKKTAERVTVGGISFNDLVTKIDEVYIDANNSRIPVVDAYLYAVQELKNASPSDLKGYMKLLQKTYPAPQPPKPTKPSKKP